MQVSFARLRAQYGFTLLELSVVIAITAMLIGTLVFLGLSHRPGSPSATRYDLLSAMALAQGDAAGNPTGNGATLVLATNAGQTTIGVYDGRPNGYGFIATPRHQVIAPLAIAVSGQNAVVATSPIAVFIDSFGAATYANWAPGAANLAVLPACDPSGAPLKVLYSGGSVMMSNCYAKFAAYDAKGTVLQP